MITDDPTPAAPRDPNKPSVVFPSAYRLTADQERKLVDEALQRLRETERQLGRDLVLEMDWWGSASTDQVHSGAKSFLGRRQLFELTYEGEMEWRASVMGELFAESNWVVPISRRVVTHQVARANAHFFGSEPWFSADLTRLEVDPDLRKSAERWVRSKFTDAEISPALQGAVESAFVRGESVVKRGRRDIVDLFETEMEVMVDTKSGKPVVDSRGEYVTRERKVRIERQPAPAPPVPSLLPEAEPPMIDVAILDDDPVTALPPADRQRYETRIVPRRNTIYSGIYAEECYFKDILIPLTARDIDTAPHVFHCYDTSVVELADQWRRNSTGISEAQRNIDTQNAVAAIQAMRGNRDSYAAAHDIESGATATHRPERPEDRAAYEHGAETARPENATAKVVECWMRIDANGDGITENILLVLDRETEIPIYYDHVGNITPDGKRPFSVVRINPVKNRWYGVGSMQVFEMIQNIVDLQMNRWNYAQGASGRITFFNRHAIEGAETDPDLELNWGETYQLKEDYTAKDAVDYVTLPEVKGADLKAILDFYLHMAHSMSGVQQPNDVGVQASEASKTATSIIQMTNGGQEMFGQLLSHLHPGVLGTANALAEIAIVNMADDDPYSWMDGNETQFALFSRKQVGEARLQIRLLLSKYKAEQEKVSLSEGLTRAAEFYTLPPEAQSALAVAYQAYLRALDFQSVDELIKPIGQIAAPPAPDPSVTGTGAPFGEPRERADPEANTPQTAAGISGGLAAAHAAAAAGIAV